MEVLVVPADPSEPEGDEVVRKTASLPGERERILREAQVLKAAAERGVAGVPRLVAAPSAESAVPSLVTRAVAGPSLAVAAPLPVLEVAGVAAEVARLLANLHEAGLVHGAVEPSHVVLDGAGGAVLVGLGDGGLTGTASPDSVAGDLDPAADVAAWGMLVGHLLDWSATSDDEPLGELRKSLATRRVRRAGRRSWAPRRDDDERRVLAALADQAQDPDPARRPSARSLAVAVAHRIPAARVPGAAALIPPTARPGTLLDRLAAHVLAGSAGPSPDPAVAEVTPPPSKVGDERRGPPAARRRPPGGRKPHRTTARVLVPSAPGGPGPRRAAAPAAPADPPAAAPEEEAPHEHPLRRRAGARRPTRRGATGAAAVALALLGVAALGQLQGGSPGRHPGTAAPTRACATVEPPAADVDGDGCEEPVQWAAGVLQAGSARFALGGAGDAWAVGDWDCDGRRTPALLHDGALAVFDAWPGPGGELQGRQVATSAGAAGLTVVVGPDGCDRPALHRPGTSDLPIDARRHP